MDTFLRCLVAGFLAHLQGKVSWVNEFSSGPVDVVVPFYYSLTGSDRFIQDAFMDDAAGKRVENTTDVIPRGMVAMKSFNAKAAEFSNPNVPMLLTRTKDGTMERVIVDVKPIPVKITFEVKIRVDSEGDFFECWQRVMDTMWLYRSFSFEYQRLKVDADVSSPSDYEDPTIREFGLKDDNVLDMTLSMEVHTMYPVINWAKARPALGAEWKANVWDKRKKQNNMP